MSKTFFQQSDYIFNVGYLTYVCDTSKGLTRPSNAIQLLKLKRGYSQSNFLKFTVFERSQCATKKGKKAHLVPYLKVSTV